MKRVLFLLVLAFALTTGNLLAQSYLKVMSYNVRLSVANDSLNAWPLRRGASERMLQLERPALLGLQEACPDQVEYFDTVLPQYHRLGVGREDGKAEGEMMAIYFDTTIFDLEDWGSFWLSETPDVPSLGWDAACKRTCTWAVLLLRQSGKRLLFLDTHLDHMGVVAREQEVRQIADSIQSLVVRQGLGEQPIVLLTADFNTGAANRIFQPLKAILNEARENAPVSDHEYTFNGFGSVQTVAEHRRQNPEEDYEDQVVIDHVFYSNLQPLSFRVLRDDYGVPFISDHFPVVFEARLCIE